MEPIFTEATQENIKETSVDWQRDLEDLRSGARTKAQLMCACLEGADADREEGWEDYVESLMKMHLGTMTPCIRIVCDNAGGLTLQIVNGFCDVYQHHSDDPEQVALDLIARARGARISEWDGNEVWEHGWLEPTGEQLRNGAYRIYTPRELLEAEHVPSGEAVIRLRAELQLRLRGEPALPHDTWTFVGSGIQHTTDQFADLSQLDLLQLCGITSVARASRFGILEPVTKLRNVLLARKTIALAQTALRLMTTGYRERAELCITDALGRLEEFGDAGGAYECAKRSIGYSIGPHTVMNLALPD